MFVKNHILKNEEILIDNGCSLIAKVTLSIDQDDKSILVVVESINDEDTFFYWNFAINKCFGVYFDIRNTIDFTIEQSESLGEFVEMLNEIFENDFYDRLTASSYIDRFGCEDCEKRNQCEEYFKHRS